jgi:hypothetical protein
MKNVVKKEIGHNPKNLTYQKMINTLIEYFQGDKDKAMAFYMTRQQSLDNMSPYELVKHGKGERLMKLIAANLIIG